jgi:hypothetical protein
MTASARLPLASLRSAITIPFPSMDVIDGFFRNHCGEGTGFVEEPSPMWLANLQSSRMMKDCDGHLWEFIVPHSMQPPLIQQPPGPATASTQPPDFARNFRGQPVLAVDPNTPAVDIFNVSLPPEIKRFNIRVPPGRSI